MKRRLCLAPRHFFVTARCQYGWATARHAPMVRLMALDGVGVTSYAFPSCRWHTSGHSAILVLFVGGPRCRRASIQLYRYNQKNACNGLQYNTVASLKTCFQPCVSTRPMAVFGGAFASISVPLTAVFVGILEACEVAFVSGFLRQVLDDGFELCFSIL